MKKILFLLLSILLLSCSKNEEVKPEDENNNSETADIFEQVKLRTKDSIGLDVISYTTNAFGNIYKDKLIFSGVKQGKLWFGIFSIPQNQTNGNFVGEEISSYTTQLDYPLQRNITIGHGEYKTLNITAITLSIWGDIKNKNFEVMILGKENDIIESINIFTMTTDFIVVRDNIEKHYKDTYYSQKFDWYNHSMVFNNFNALEYNYQLTANMVLYSESGDSLFYCNVGDVFSVHDTIIPVNYEEGIGIKGTYFERINIRNGNIAWNVAIPDIPSNAKISMQKTDEVDTKWYYTMNITNYDGSKESRNFRIDIKNGEYRAVTVEEDKEPVTEVSIIELENNTAFMIGSELQLTYKVLPENAYNKNVNIYSSDESVVYIDKDMRLHAKAKGKAIITIASEDGFASKNYNVEVGDINSLVTLSVSTSGISVDGTYNGFVSSNLINKSDYQIQIKSIEIIDKDGKCLFTANEELLTSVLPHSESEVLSIKINNCYYPKLIWKYEYNGNEYTIEHNIVK